MILQYFLKYFQLLNLQLSCEVEEQIVNYSVSCRVVALSSGYGVGLAPQWSRARFPTAARMGDRLWADKSPQYFTKPARPTQPPALSGTGNEYSQSEVTFCGPGVKAWRIPLPVNAYLSTLEMTNS